MEEGNVRDEHSGVLGFHELGSRFVMLGPEIVELGSSSRRKIG